MEEKSTKITILVDGSQGKAETAEIQKGFEGIAKSAQSSAIGTTGALNQIEAGEKALAASTQELLALQNQLAESSATVAALEERLAAAEEQAATAAAQAAAAMKLLAAGTNEAGEAADLAAGRIVRVGVAASRFADVAIPGGRALSTLAGAFSVAGLATVGLIAGIGILVGYLLQLGKAKDDDIQITYDQVKANEAYQASQATGNLWTRALAQSIHDENAAKEALKQKIVELQIARANEAEAIAKENTGLKVAAASQEDLRTKLVLYVVSLVASTGSIVENTQERLKKQQAMMEEAQKYMALGAARGLDTQAMKAEIGTLYEDKAVLDQVVEAINRGIYAEQQFAAGHEALNRIRQKVAIDFAEHTRNATKAQLEAAVAAEAEREHVTGLLDTQKEADKNMQLMTEHTKTHTGAIRAYNNELINLKKQLEDAKAAADAFAGSFEKQEQKIRDNTKALLDHMVANARDRAEMRATIIALGEAQLEALGLKAIQAEKRIDDEIREMRIQAIEDVNARESAQIQFRMEKKIEEIQTEFGYTERAWDQIVRVAEAADEEMQRHLVDATRKAAEESMKVVREVHKEEADEALKYAHDYLNQEWKAYSEQERRITQLANALGSAKGGIGPVFQVEQLERIDGKLQHMGASMSEVDKIFGSTSRSADQLEQRIDMLTDKGITGFGELKDVAADFMKTIVQTGKLYEMLGGIISNMFESIASGSASFGKALLKAFLDAIAQIATMLGTLFLLAAAGLQFIPGLNWTAGPLLAAGFALMAFAGALKGLSSLISSSSAGSSAATGGSSAAGANTATTAAPAGHAPKPTFLNVPTAPKSAAETLLEAQRDLAIQRSNREALATRDAMLNQLGPITIEITLGPDAGAQFLTGIFNKKGVLTIDNAIGKNRKRLKAALSGV